MSDDFNDSKADERQEDGRDRDHGDEVEETHEQALKRVELQVLREAGMKFGDAMNKYAFYILNHHSSRIAMWIICYVLELKPAWGKTLEDIGKLCGGLTRQMIDKEVQKFISVTGYKGSTPMKSQRASRAYRVGRINSILENQEPEELAA